MITQKNSCPLPLEDPLAACNAAANRKNHTHTLMSDVVTKEGVPLRRVSTARINRIRDLFEFVRTPDNEVEYKAVQARALGVFLLPNSLLGVKRRVRRQDFEGVVFDLSRVYGGRSGSKEV